MAGVLIYLAFLAATMSPAEAHAPNCSSLRGIAGSKTDASGAILNCIQTLPAGARLALPAGVYRLRRQLIISKPVTISTAGVGDAELPCDKLAPGRCATIVVDLDGSPNPNIMPIEIASNEVVLSHLVIEGHTSAQRRSDCRLAERRPLGGGLRIRGSGFTLTKSTLRNFTCYTTVEALAGLRNLTFDDNRIGPNGDHRPGEIWSDGITIHDAEDAVVRRNTFVDNTDVQLIFGGCRRCVVQGNHFRHTGSFSGAAFAELMLQAFPSTSGNYSGTSVTMNDIDCGSARRCGYGIMIGANPWKAGDNPRYPGAMFGGSIRLNVVRNAMIGMNIDSPTGTVEVDGNRVEKSGGLATSDCGRRNWPAVNIAPGAARYVRGRPANLIPRSVSTTSCMINRISM